MSFFADFPETNKTFVYNQKLYVLNFTVCFNIYYNHHIHKKINIPKNGDRQIGPIDEISLRI